MKCSLFCTATCTHAATSKPYLTPQEMEQLEAAEKLLKSVGMKGSLFGAAGAPPPVEEGGDEEEGEEAAAGGSN